MFMFPPFSRQIRMFDVLSRAQSKYHPKIRTKFTPFLPYISLPSPNLTSLPLILIGDYFLRFIEEDEGTPCRNHRLCFRQNSGKRHFILLTDMKPDAWTWPGQNLAVFKHLRSLLPIAHNFVNDYEENIGVIGIRQVIYSL